MQFAFYELVAGTPSKPELRLVETSQDIPWIRSVAERQVREQFDRIVSAAPRIGPILVLTAGRTQGMVVAVESQQDYPPREIVWVHCGGLTAELHGDIASAGAEV
jgi:hypothetical protein